MDDDDDDDGGAASAPLSPPPPPPPPLPLPTPPVLDLFIARGGGTGTATPDAVRALVDLVILGVIPLVGGGILADVDLFRTPAEDPLEPCLRDDDVDGTEADKKGVVGREAVPRKLGPAPLASVFTLRYLHVHVQ